MRSTFTATALVLAMGALSVSTPALAQPAAPAAAPAAPAAPAQAANPGG